MVIVTFVIVITFIIDISNVSFTELINCCKNEFFIMENYVGNTVI